MDNTRKIRLQGSDGGIIETTEKTVKCSDTITTILEISGEAEDGTPIVPITNITSDILQKVVDWAKHHANDPLPYDDGEEEDEERRKNGPIPEWDAEFLQVDKETLLDLISAANYLVIKGLFDVTCKKIALMIQGKTIEEMRSILNVPNDFNTE